MWSFERFFNETSRILSSSFDSNTLSENKPLHVPVQNSQDSQQLITRKKKKQFSIKNRQHSNMHFVQYGQYQYWQKLRNRRRARFLLKHRRIIILLHHH